MFSRFRASRASPQSSPPFPLIESVRRRILRAVGALRALVGSTPSPEPPEELSREEAAALDRLSSARRERDKWLEVKRRTEVLGRVLAGEEPVPEDMVLTVGGRTYPPGSWYRRTLRPIQGGGG